MVGGVRGKVTVIVWVRWASAAECSSWNRDKAWARGRTWYRTWWCELGLKEGLGPSQM